MARPDIRKIAGVFVSDKTGKMYQSSSTWAAGNTRIRISLSKNGKVIIRVTDEAGKIQIVRLG